MIDKQEDSFPNFEKLIEAAPESRAPLSVVPTTADIIPITCESGKASVDARDLHAFLEVGKDFSTWIKDRIQQFGFVDGQDYSPISGNRSDGMPGKARAEYTLSMDMAKELSMVERTDKGKQARQYFIACEKRMLEGQQSFQLPTTFSEALALAAKLEVEREKMEKQLAIAMPKAEALDRISTSDGSTCITNAAKALQMRPKDLFQWLQANNWIFRRGADWNAYQARLSQGVMDHKVTVTSRGDGSEKMCIQALVTSIGLTKLASILGKEVA